jgi:type IV pilus assembly protein PilQ
MALLDAGRASLVFSFLNQDSESELLANPRVVTTDNGKAKINITQQYPIPQFTFSEQTASFQISGFEYKDIGIVLTVTPRINKDDVVTLEVAPEVSSSANSVPFSSGNGVAFNIPIIDIRQASTTVLIKSGTTLAMGGLIREDVSDAYTKVPVMGDIPGLGALFRSKTLNRLKRNLLVFLTPTVVNPDVKNPTGLEQFSGGLPSEAVFTNDKWMPKDNAKPRDLMKEWNKKKATSNDDIQPTGKAPTQNFGAK